MALNIAELITSLPQILQIMQVVTYVVFVLFFGSIAVRGWRGAPSRLVSILLRLGAGFVCLIAGIAFSPVFGPLMSMPGLSAEILKLFQIDMIVTGFLFSIIMAIAIALVSTNLPGSAERIERIIEKLQRKAKKIHEGEVKAISPQRIAGAVIIIVIVVLSAMYFQGFPSISEELFSALGPMMGEAGGIDMTQLSQMSPACTGVMTSLFEVQQTSPQLLVNLEVYTNPTLKSTIESETGDTVVEMYSLEYKGTVMVLALMQSGKRCIATDTEYCFCAEE